MLLVLLGSCLFGLLLERMFNGMYVMIWAVLSCMMIVLLWSLIELLVLKKMLINRMMIDGVESKNE